ncbi:hypothetical protein [Aquimarina algiphila]|uniref:hypothetical protein n=1 Tax=Aquimarina algiphila TaxID=2047982 RepID=UPI00249140AE|nr:hypothetical protein [Aquimarina algiphila]
MKNSSLEKFRSFEMSKELTKTVSGNSCHENLGKCIETALDNDNDFLVEICVEVLCD